MKKTYAIIIAIYMFSGVLTMINNPNGDGSGGLFENQQMTETGIELNQSGFGGVDDAFATVREVNEVDSDENQFSIWDAPGLIWKAATFVGTTLFNAHFTYFLCVDYGAPVGLALLINGTTGLIQAYGYTQLISGRFFGGA